MAAYFKPLRRKIGVMTLVTACLLMAGWVRSKTIGEALTFTINQKQVVGIGSNLGIVTFSRITGGTTPKNVYARWEAQPQEWMNVVMQRDENWGVVHFEKATSVTAPRIEFDVLKISYWSIVIPLTLLSAWLMLSKPRRKQLPVSAPSNS